MGKRANPAPIAGTLTNDNDLVLPANVVRLCDRRAPHVPRSPIPSTTRTPTLALLFGFAGMMSTKKLRRMVRLLRAEMLKGGEDTENLQAAMLWAADVHGDRICGR